MTITFYLNLDNGKYKIKGTDSFDNKFTDVLSYGPTDFKTINIVKGTQLILHVNTNKYHPFLIVKNSTNPDRIQNDNNKYTGIIYPSENYLTGKWKKSEVLLGDTDTNAAITGALLGAYYGITKIEENEITKENIKTILNCDTTKGDIIRPKEYTLNIEFINNLFDN